VLNYWLLLKVSDTVIIYGINMSAELHFAAKCQCIPGTNEASTRALQTIKVTLGCNMRSTTPNMWIRYHKSDDTPITRRTSQLWVPKCTIASHVCIIPYRTTAPACQVQHRPQLRKVCRPTCQFLAAVRVSWQPNKHMRRVSAKLVGLPLAGVHFSTNTSRSMTT